MSIGTEKDVEKPVGQVSRPPGHQQAHVRHSDQAAIGGHGARAVLDQHQRHTQQSRPSTVMISVGESGPRRRGATKTAARRGEEIDGIGRACGRAAARGIRVRNQHACERERRSDRATSPGKDATIAIDRPRPGKRAPRASPELLARLCPAWEAQADKRAHAEDRVVR